MKPANPKKERSMAEPIYLHNWKCKEDMVGDFADVSMSGEEYYAEKAPYANVEYWLEKKAKMKAALESGTYDVNVLLASYDTPGYEGDAFVLFEKDGQLYEVNGGHCSCYGLEGQWNPELTTKEALLHRLNEGRLGTDGWSEPRKNVFAAELRQVLEAIS